MQIKNHYIFVLTIILVVILHSLGLFSALNDRLYDQYILLNQLKSVSNQITIISIDSKSINALGDWPFKRLLMARALTKVFETKPAVIGVNLSFTEKKDPSEDNALYHALKSFNNITIAAPLEISNINQSIPVLTSLANSIFPEVNHSHTYIQRAKNGTVTLLRPYLNYKNHKYYAFSIDVLNFYYRSLNLTMPIKLLRFLTSLESTDNNKQEILIDYRRAPGQFKQYSFLDLINNEIPASQLENKIVLIGLTDQNLTSKYITPFAGKKALTSTPIELHAQIIDSLLNYRGLKACPDLLLYLFSILLALLGFYLYRKRTALIQGGIFISLLLITSLFDFVLFKYFAIWLPPALPLILIICLFGLSIYFTITNVDIEIIDTINIFRKKQKLPLAEVPSDIRSRVGALKDLLTIIANDRNTINAIIDGVNNGIIVFDNIGNIKWANARILDLYKESLVLETNIERIIEDIQIKNVFDEIAQNSTFKKEIMLKGFEFMCIINAIKSETQQYVAIFNDITELKQISRLKTNMVRMVSHELKNPLSAILLSAENITFIEDRDIVLENANNIIETSEILKDTITNFLNLSKIESNILKIEPTSANLIEVIDKSIMIQKPLAEKKKVDIIFDSKDIPLVLIDKEQILIVINNLIANAIKYSLENGKILIDIEQNTGFVKISVTDYGIGIPEDEVDKVFDKFFRSRNNKKGNIEGTGLGLSIVSSIVSKHHGEITLNSKYGKGSCFSFTLPVAL